MNTYYGYGMHGVLYQGAKRSSKIKITNQKYQVGDTVVMNLDLSTKQLCFSSNNWDQWVAFKNIQCQQGLKYRLAVSFGSLLAGIRLLSFEIQ